jgi:divinyl protochlorophyllide a 8-vinyl-reductase
MHNVLYMLLETIRQRPAKHTAMPMTASAKIGPNAIIQPVTALRERYGETRAHAILEQGGQAHLCTQLPEHMVDEGDFHELVRALAAQLGPEPTHSLLYEAGERTARYLLQHRIPRPFQALVKRLPRLLGLRLLMWAIGKHAWTFVGSGQFRFVVQQKQPTIHLNVSYPSIPPVASFYGGTFAQLIQVLIDPQATVQTSASDAAGTLDCRYKLVWHSAPSV